MVELIESSTSPLTRAFVLCVALGGLVVVLNAVGGSVSAWMSGPAPEDDRP